MPSGFNTTLRLTHVKEKLQFIQVENAALKKQLAKTEEELAVLRDKLGQVPRVFLRRAIFAGGVRLRRARLQVPSKPARNDFAPLSCR